MEEEEEVTVNVIQAKSSASKRKNHLLSWRQIDR